MNSLEQKYLEVTNNYFKWMEDVQRYEDEMKAFENESTELQSKLDVLFKEFVVSSESSSPSIGNNIDLLISFMSTAAKFSNNMTEYYDKKIEFEKLFTDFFNKLSVIQKDLGVKNLGILIEQFVSTEELYIPKINAMLDTFKEKLPLLRIEYNNLKAEYNKYIQ